MSNEDIESQYWRALPKQAQPFIRFQIPEKTCENNTIPARIIGEAVDTIFPYVSKKFEISIIVGGAPFVTYGSIGGKRTFAPPEEMCGLALDSTIYLKCGKLAAMDDNVAKAIVLEELAHVWLNISDERLVGDVVASIFDEIEVNHSHDDDDNWISKEYTPI